MKNISTHITYAEATKSQEAIRLGLNNNPNPEQLANMRRVAQSIFEPLRKHFGKPIGISSFFRSAEINKHVGGSLTSQHCTGEAIDIDADIFGKLTNRDIFYYIKNSLTFDQLIWEFGGIDNPAWVHVSFKASGNRNMILKAEKSGNKVLYTKI
jgi:zinc D-Ala-D-Ala carboxypeptidase